MAEAAEHRRLAAIMFTDMVGYSAMSQRNETLALELLEEHRRLLRTLFSNFNGREVETTGDGFLVEFASALEAARCAIEIQRALATRNISASADRVIQVRIGIHVGDVIHKDGHVLGDGVNIAARLQPLAEPGGICISVDVARQVQRNLEATVVNVGHAELKNIQLPFEICRIVLPWQTRQQPLMKAVPSANLSRVLLVVGVLGLAALGAAVWRATHRTEKPTAGREPVVAPGTAPRPRRVEWLAVLPLRNLSGDTNQNIFVEGMADLLTTELSHIAELQVKSFTTTMSYQGTKKSASEIGRELKVDALVEGSMLKDGDKVLINIQVIDALNDRHFWSKTYARSFDDLWKVKGELAEAIAREIQINLTPQEQQRLASARARNPEAVEQYLKGRYFVNRTTEGDLQTSMVYFRRALEIEPDYAEAYAGLAKAYTYLSSVYRPPLEMMPQAKTNALAALRIDDTLAEARHWLGWITLVFDYNFEEARKHFETALKINPNSADAHDGLALYLQVTGQMTEAVAQDEIAYRLDPLSVIIAPNLVSTLFFARQYHRAIREGTEMLKIQKDNHMIAAWIGFAQTLSGDPQSAVRLLEPICSLKEQPPLVLGSLAYAYASARQIEDAHRTLDKLEAIARQQYVCVYEIATVHVALGEFDAAFEWLDRAYANRADCIPITNVEPRFDPLRQDNRFKALLRKIGF